MDVQCTFTVSLLESLSQIRALRCRTVEKVLTRPSASERGLVPSPPARRPGRTLVLFPRGVHGTGGSLGVNGRAGSAPMLPAPHAVPTSKVILVWNPPIPQCRKISEVTSPAA